MIYQKAFWKIFTNFRIWNIMEKYKSVIQLLEGKFQEAEQGISI